MVDGESLHRAEEILHFLWRHLAERSRSAAFNSILTSPPVILVANKIDLVRSRIVSTQGTLQDQQPAHSMNSSIKRQKKLVFYIIHSLLFALLRSSCSL